MERISARGPRVGVNRSAGLLIVGIVLISAVAATAQTVERVVHISVDGLNVPMLRGLLDESPELVPGFSRLVAEGAYTFNARTDYDYTTTVPNHVSMITGRPVVQPEGQPITVHHGITTNGPATSATIHSIGNPELGYIPSVFDAVHDRGLGTAFFASKTRLAAFVERSYNAQYGAPDALGADNGRDKIDAYFNLDGDSDAAVTNYLAAMDATPRTYSLVHIVDPDYAGHATDWESDAYRDAVLATDERVKRILDYVTADADFAGKTAVLLTTDHGGEGENHTDPLIGGSYTIPAFLWGPEIPAGVDLYSIFANRSDPGDGRPDYDAPQQPFRNGDTGNLALALLGLPPVDGSSLIPVLSLAPEPIPGDIDRSGSVDRLDMALFASHFGTPGATWETGDFNGDGHATLLDLAILQANLAPGGASPRAAVSPAATSVPEPAAVALSALAIVALLVKARRR